MAAKRNRSAQEHASSGCGMGERHRTNAFTARFLGGALFCVGGARSLFTVAALALAGALSVPAQVTLTLGGEVPAIGPGTKYPTIMACNKTSLPLQVEGWKFKTKDYAGYSTWMAGFTHTGTAPVEYTQKISETEQQMMGGVCRSSATDYTGALAAGQDATPFDLQALIKTGSCSELPPYKDAAPITCTDIDGAAKPDYGNQCLIDPVGANGGDTYGGFVSTFYGQTQIQYAIPTATMKISNTDVKWNPYRMGPQYMMAVAMGQEILNVDMQWLLAIAGKETGAAMVNVGNNQVRSEDGSYSDLAGSFGYWQVETFTYATYMLGYPQFFPKYGPCMAKFPDVTTALTAGRCVDQSWAEAAMYYMQPPGHNKMEPNSPQIANGVFATSMGWYNVYDALANSTDLCFVDAIQNGVDKRLAFAALIPGYNMGRFSTFTGPLKDANLKNDPKASEKFPIGYNNYRTEVFAILDQFEVATKDCANRKVYDTTISLKEVQRFLFGGNDVTGTPQAQSDGGMLAHYVIPTPEREALWSDIQCAFGKLKGKAPSTLGKDSISYRYDWLTMLRVVKKHLPSRIYDRKLPVEPDWQHLVKENSQNPRTCSGKVRDTEYPSLSITSPAMNSVVSPVVAPGAKFSFTAKDNSKISKADWSFDPNWLAWQPASLVSGNNYEFYVPCEMAGYPKKGAKASLWVRSTDDCGNSTVQQFDFTAHSSMNCGDPPVPPQVATPIATPNGREFSALSPGVSVSLTVATLGASILYTVDGSDPDSVVGGMTKQYTGAAILITDNTTLKARAVKIDMQASAIMTEVYKKVAPAKVATPVANPGGRNFTGTLNVALTTATAGAAIYYTTDGSIPSDAAGTTARRYGPPVSLNASTVLKAIAILEGMYPSDVMTETYTGLPPITVKQAWYKDVNGDGRIDQAMVVFASALPAAPEKLGFTLVGEDGKSYAKTAAATEIKLAPGDATRAIITFAEPFPYGLTSLKNPATSGQTFRQDAIPLADGTFAVADSVAPVIMGTDVKERGDGGDLKRVFITYSEAVTVAAGPQPLIFKRGSNETPSAEVIFANIEKTGDRNYVLHIDTNSTFFPIIGDSAAIPALGATADAFGNVPAVKLYRKLEGQPPKAKPVSLTITFPNGSAMNPAMGVVAINPAGTLFIPVDKQGNVLAGHCPGCVAKDGQGYVGPVFKILTPGAVDYTFKIFGTGGEFVAEGKGSVNPEDLNSLTSRTDALGRNYEAPVVWTGLTRAGTHAGTGAYIIIATFLTKKDLTSGAEPTTFTEKKRFGLLRNWSGS